MLYDPTCTPHQGISQELASSRPGIFSSDWAMISPLNPDEVFTIRIRSAYQFDERCWLGIVDVF